MKMTPEQKIIHDLNGHLFVIQGRAEMLKSDLGDRFVGVDEIILAARKATKVTKAWRDQAKQ